MHHLLPQWLCGALKLQRHFIVPVHGSVTLLVVLLETWYRACINHCSVLNGNWCTEFILNKAFSVYKFPCEQNCVENKKKGGFLFFFFFPCAFSCFQLGTWSVHGHTMQEMQRWPNLCKDIQDKRCKHHIEIEQYQKVVVENILQHGRTKRSDKMWGYRRWDP